LSSLFCGITERVEGGVLRNVNTKRRQTMGRKPKVLDGPFTETKELITGFRLEAEDFGPELAPELREREERLGSQAAAKR